jgi:hypothetical protein
LSFQILGKLLWYITFPSALAQAMDFTQGETVEWFVEDKSLLALRRSHPPGPLLKKAPPASSPTSPNTVAPNARKPSR